MSDDLENGKQGSETKLLGATRPALKWPLIGVAALALMLGGAAYALLRLQVLQRSRAAEVAELLAEGRQQEQGNDYHNALDSFQQAEQRASASAGLWRFVVSQLTTQREEAHRRLEQLAEKWVWQQVTHRMESGITDVDETPIKALSAYAQTASGAEKGDLLAYIGYGTFLKGCLTNGDRTDQQPVAYYREALAVDPQNPYAHAFWGHLILCGGGGIASAQPHFEAALAAHRDRERVRDVELYALANSRDIGIISTYLWLKLVNEMHKAGEPLGQPQMQILASDYGSASLNRKVRKELYGAVTPADHVELAHSLLDSEGAGGYRLAVKVMLAYSLEAAGSRSEALGAWQDVQRTAQQTHDPHYQAATHQALRRLGALGKPHAKTRRLKSRAKKHPRAAHASQQVV